MKVLLIEDVSEQQSSIDNGLQHSGYNIDRVFDGREAITRASNQAYDLIILDLMLSRDSSLLVLHEIRELNRDVEILILSSREQIRDRVTALIQGADDYLVKPFSADDLQTRVVSLLNRRIAAKSSACSENGLVDSTSHLNGLIENLLQLCRYENEGFELVISETRLSSLLAAVCSQVKKAATWHDVVLRLPEHKLPGLLVDARWMEHLLVNLLNHAISHSLAHSEIGFDFRTDDEYGTLTVEGLMPLSLQGEDLKRYLWDCGCAESGADNLQPVDPLSLAKSCADGMNLKLSASITDDNRFRFQLCNIRVV